MNALLRMYLDSAEIGADGYPFFWHGVPRGQGSIKDYVREQAGNRCERCGHPYEKGLGEWSPCDELCTHEGLVRTLDGYDEEGIEHSRTEAQWRILTVHHLNGIKHDCRWWNLAALCQRCHLTIQGRVHMDRVFALEHSEWFKPHAAGWYAFSYLGVDLSREETIARLDELLDLERIA